VKATSGLVVRRRWSGLLASISCIRFQDVILLQGSPLLGVAFALDEITPAAAAKTAVFAVASMLLVAHIFSLNDWAGAASDARDPNKSADVFVARGITRRAIGWLSLGLLAASMLLFAVLPGQTLIIAGAIAVLGAIYSHPSIDAKGTPVFSSVPHLLGGTLHFLLGYSLFTNVDRRGVLLALFFALTFTAGHLTQEVRDHDGDRLNAIRTNAVRFGKTAAFLAGLVVFTLAYADLVVLARAGLVSAALGWLAAALYPLHLFWSAATLRAGLTFDGVSQLQARYRMLYGLIGLAMVVTLLVR
jgi:4-hydroxybenzoate polyprenyltransferase